MIVSKTAGLQQEKGHWTKRLPVLVHHEGTVVLAQGLDKREPCAFSGTVLVSPVTGNVGRCISNCLVDCYEEYEGKITIENS